MDYSVNKDISAPILGDMVPESLVKVFPYEMVMAQKANEFAGDNSVSIVAISQEGLDSINEELSTDTEAVYFSSLNTNDKGNRYFNMYAAITSTAKLDFSASTSSYGMELKLEQDFTALANWTYEGTLNQIKSGNMKFMPVMCTIGKPFDRRLYENDLYSQGWYEIGSEFSSIDRLVRDESTKINSQAATLLDAIYISQNNIGPKDGDKFSSGGNWYEYANEVGQPAYLMSTSIEAKEGQAQHISDNINPEGLYEFSLANISVLESNYTNSVIKFSQKIGDHLIIGDGTLDTYTYPQGGIYSTPGFSMELQTDSLINRIVAKGRVEEIDSDVDLKVVEQMTTLKATPISLQDKLSMFMDWFDYDAVMPEFIAELFVNGASIDSLRNEDIDNSGKTTPFFSDAEVNLIGDMLAYSAAYATSFAQFPRNATGSDAGKIQSDQTIGSKKAKLVAIEGKDPIKVIDGLFKTYIRENPADDNSIEFRAMKQILAALSRYIYSNYAIGKGENSFNQIYLPWTLMPSGEISLDSKDKNWTFDTSKKFQLVSRWFDITNGKISPKQDVNLSDVQLIQTDRKLTIPMVGNNMNEVSKLSSPGDIDTKSAKDLQYFWHLPLDQLNFEKLFLNDVSVTTDNKNQKKTFDTGWTAYGQTIPTDENAWIKTQAAAHFKLQESKINVVSGVGTIESSLGSTTKAGLSDISSGGGKSQGNQAIFGSALWTSLPENGNINYKGDSNMTDQQYLQAVSVTIGVPVDALEVVVNNARYRKWSRSNTLYWQGSSYALKRFRMLGAQVIIDGRTTTISLDRDTLFDKVGWHFFVNDYLNVSSALKEYHFTEERGLNINSIKEITISQIWGNEAILHIGFDTINIPLFNDTDETIASQRILFT